MREQFAIAFVTAVSFARASDAPLAANLESIPNFSGTITIESATPGPLPGLAGPTGVWVRYAPSLPVDCSPPRGCYASTQRLHYSFNCVPRYAILVERTSFDLNGTIIKHEALGHYAPSNDEAANRVLTAFCGYRDRD